MAVKPEELKVGQIIKAIFSSGINATSGYMRITGLGTHAVWGVRVTRDGKPYPRLQYADRTVSHQHVLSIVHQPEEVS